MAEPAEAPALEDVSVAVESAPGSFVLGLRAPVLVPDDERQGAPGGTTPPAPFPVTSEAEAVGAAALRAGIRDAGPLALAGFAANGANVVVTVLMARLLTTRGYGALAQLTSLFLIVSLPGTAVTVGVVRRVTGWHEQGVAARVWAWARRSHAAGSALVGAGALAVMAARGPLAHLLSIPAPLGVFAVLSAGAVWVLLSFDRGLLQAHRDYRALSVNLLVEGAVRTGAVLGLVGAGLGVAGVAWGLLLAEVVTALHARVVADRAWAVEARQASEAEAPGAEAPEAEGVAAEGAGAVGAGSWAETDVGRAQRRLLLLDVGAALGAMGLLAWLQNIDVIVLGRDAPHHSGAYAAISVASKALVFGAFVLGGYLLPEAAIRWRRGQHALRQLGVTLLVLGVPVLALLVAAVGFPHLLLSVVFSSRYLGDASSLAVLVLAMACLSTTVMLTMYLLAAGWRWVAGILLVGAAAATVAVALAHGRARATTGADLAVQGALLAVVGVVFVLVHRRRPAAVAA